ncbi:ectoine/hydroxyectoine ABC transporter substrate-binding protein EhuB, partial [Roseateles sp. GG27B]
MKNLFKIPVAAIIIAAAALSITTTARAETTMERIQRTGEIRIGYANEAPFAYTRPDGTVTGESPEITRVIFKTIGVT